MSGAAGLGMEPPRPVTMGKPVREESERFVTDRMERTMEREGEHLMVKQEQSPAYEALHRHGLLTTSFRIKSVSELDLVKPNSSKMYNTALRSSLFACCLPGIADAYLHKQFEVADGRILLGYDDNGVYYFFGSGVHRVQNAFLHLEKKSVSLLSTKIIHGNRGIVTVPQGYVGMLYDRGQPVLLPPGMHQWKSDTIEYKDIIDLREHVIHFGPYTLLTVDEGYAAVTQNNGVQHIMAGGHTHMLTHRNWKFEKFMTQKIQTNDLDGIQASTGDNIVLRTNACVIWKVVDIAKAARNAAETMRPDGRAMAGDDITKMRNDVLKQATSSLSAFIGGVRFSDTASAHSVASHSTARSGQKTSGALGGSGLLFDVDRLDGCVKHANRVCEQFGVEVMAINVISAFPTDAKLCEAMAKGAVAAAEAEQSEVNAQGNAKALICTAQAEAEATRLKANADADAERIRSQGVIDGAQMLDRSSTAVALAKITRTGDALGNKSAFFFGGRPEQMETLLANPNVVNTVNGQKGMGGLFGS